MNLIVVGTDGSETATKAVGMALDFAKQTGAKVAVVSAYTPQRSLISEDSGAEGAWKDGFSEAKVDLVLAEAVASGRAQGVEVQTHVRKGDAAEAILAVAEEESADLIVVGNKGMSGARRFLIGNVPNKVTHHAPCSVLVVRTT